MKKLLLFLAMTATAVYGADTYRTMELRQISHNPKANGETDFKGPTEIYSTDQRVDFLTKYAGALSTFFNDPNLDKMPVSTDMAKAVVAKIKPQPLPSVREKVLLDSWKFIGYSNEKAIREKESLKYWQSLSGVEVVNNTLKFKSQATVSRSFEPIDWRGKVRIILNSPTPGQTKIKIGDEIVIESLTFTKGENHTIDVDIDLDKNGAGGYNLYIDGVKVVDYATFKLKKAIDKITITSPAATTIENILVTKFGYKEFKELHDRDEPYTIKTLVDDTFGLTPSPKDCSELSYNDAQWAKTPEMPFAYGGERYKEEKLYLRTIFKTSANFRKLNAERAILNIEAISPSGEVWINGIVVHLSSKPTPVEIDITSYLVDGDNVVAIVVNPRKVENTNRHTAADLYTGWYAGRVWIDFRSLDYIQKPYVVTKDITEKGEAKVAVNFNVNTLRWLKAEREVKIYNAFKGSAKVELYDWFPTESSTPSAISTIPVEVELRENKLFSVNLDIPNAKLWSYQKPQLYKVVITLLDENGKAVDDMVLTTGLRTISQTGGTFRINGTPSMLNGALILGHRAPLENISRHMYCAPSYIVAQDILKIKAMNGNAIRMSHHDEVTGGTNDPRYAEYADQLGLMYEWATPAWVRSGSPWQIDFEALPLYVEQLRNHPSIVLWQPANHPKIGPPAEKAMEWFAKVYHAIWQADSSRLINPTASQIRMDAPSDDGTISSEGENVKPFAIWTAPMVTRGNMDFITGYGASWDGLRAWPDSKKWDGEQGWRANANRRSYLNSPSRAYFDFEDEESIGQHNWDLQKGKPEYLIMSYEYDMDEGSIGRALATSEWRESQAYQAMSAFEAFKKKRMLDYDGFAWCELNGGGNSGTYLKPILDYYDHAKLAYYALSMAFQPSFACSGNVDTAYGDSDTVDIVVVHWGGEEVAEVTVDIKDLSGKIIETRTYTNVKLPAGRNVVKVNDFKTKTYPEGIYRFEYTLKIK